MRCNDVLELNRLDGDFSSSRTAINGTIHHGRAVHRQRPSTLIDGHIKKRTQPRANIKSSRGDDADAAAATPREGGTTKRDGHQDYTHEEGGDCD